MTTYCQYVLDHPDDAYNKHYHDTEYGFPIEDDNLLFERLILEINQAGLSWITILKKADNFRRAYDSFDIETVARYRESDRARLLSDAGIIRNKLKINAAIENARRILEIRKEYGSFKGWLDTHHPRAKDEWVKLFKANFKFVGGEIVNEFLMSSGYLPGAHEISCPIFDMIMEKRPAWSDR